MKHEIIASSSAGNAAIVSTPGAPSLLIDAGLTLPQLRRAGVDITNLAAILVTHEHGDHTNGLNSLSSAAPCILGPENAVAPVLGTAVPTHVPTTRGVSGWAITSIPVKHDVPNVAWLIERNGKKLLHATDLSAPPPIIPGLTHAAIEMNYREEHLAWNVHIGRTKPFVAERVRDTHLEARAALTWLAAQHALRPLEDVALLHLSRVNADRESFVAAVKSLVGFKPRTATCAAT